MFFSRVISGASFAHFDETPGTHVLFARHIPILRA
jgi:hypothetical protein